jgi:hypothetical protein
MSAPSLKVTEYRSHADSPLTTLSIEPGAVVVTMLFDQPNSHTRLHSHTFDHWMEVVSGTVLIELDGVRSIRRAGERYLVEAHKRHSVVPLSLDALVRCVHENPQVHPDNVDPHLGVPYEWVGRLTEIE